MSNRFQLEGKRVVVTGASSGIGRQIALGISRVGATVVVSGRDEARLTETFSQLEPGPEHCMTIADLTRTEDIARLARVAGTINGIVHAAGIAGPAPIRVVTREFLQTRFDSNY